MLRLVILFSLAASLASPLAAQDTTTVYPRRLSYFPYLTVSPNDGAMLMFRVISFRQSRWDDRVSLNDGIAVEGGYSTRNSWLVRAQADYPRIAPGWRMQGIGEVRHYGHFIAPDDGGVRATRAMVGVEVSRAIASRVYVAVRGEAVHVSVPVDVNALAIYTSSSVSESDVRGRFALVYDGRDREYDTRSGVLIQGGVVAGTAVKSYTGWYAAGAGWRPLSERTRLTARAAVRGLSADPMDASRRMPAWEDEFEVVGGGQSNRALPVSARVNRVVGIASAELRHDLKVFPGGAVGVLAFVDAGMAERGGSGEVSVGDRVLFSRQGSGASGTDWVVGPGVGVSLRLLRNAITTATIAYADHAARVYVGAGWAW